MSPEGNLSEAYLGFIDLPITLKGLKQSHSFRLPTEHPLTSNVLQRQSHLMRAVVLLISFLPFLYYAGKDTMFHLRGRKVSTTEHILHAAIGLVLVVLFSHALMAHHLIVLSALLLFVVAGGIDEYIFHRDIPEEESNLHAKEHLALLIFLVMSLATDAVEKNDWSIVQTFAPLWGAGVKQ